MQNEHPEIAFGKSLTDIVSVVGNNYKEFVRNLTDLFPSKGAALAGMLARGKQDQLYRTGTVYKKRAKVRKARTVYSPVKPLKRLQRMLDVFVRQQFNDHESSHGFVTGRSTRTAAEAVKNEKNLNEKEMTNLDVKGAFPSITGRVIRKMLRYDAKVSLNNWQINIITKLATTSNDRLATGAPSSPSIFNWRMTAVDHELEKLTTPRAWKTIRYADDISIIHYRTQKSEVISQVVNLLNKFGLTVERKKLKTYRHNTKIITGIVVRFEKLGIPRKIRRIQRAIAHQLGHCYKAVKARNRYDASELHKLIEAIPPEVRRKDSIEAQQVGFAAYGLHVLGSRTFNTV
jgi:hypothetical protein